MLTQWILTISLAGAMTASAAGDRVYTADQTAMRLEVRTVDGDGTLALQQAETDRRRLR